MIKVHIKDDARSVYSFDADYADIKRATPPCDDLQKGDPLLLELFKRDKDCGARRVAAFTLRDVLFWVIDRSQE